MLTWMNKALDWEELTLLSSFAPKLAPIHSGDANQNAWARVYKVAGIVVETSRESCDPMMVENLPVGIRSRPAHKERASGTLQHERSE